MGQVIMRGIQSVRAILAGKRFLLVCGEACKQLEIKKLLDEIPHVEFSGFTSNPLYEQVCVGVDIFNKRNCEMLVAVGGGSAMDVAKCIKLFCRMMPGISYLEQQPFDSGIPILAVPTTAGTGSESTCHAVIYCDGEKQSISHGSIIPDYAVLEPSVLRTLPVYQKKCTMLDALCQAVESWWSVNSTEESKEYSREAVVRIRDNWKAYIEGSGEEVCWNMMEAANFAGRAINITATTAAHAMSYKLTSMYHLPHGHAVALCMREVWSHMADHIDDCVDSRGKEYLRYTFDEISALAGVSWFCGLLDELDMACPESDQKHEDTNVLARSVNLLRLKNHPVELDAGVLKKMYEGIVKS